MNRYGHQAMKHWMQFDPQRYAPIANPAEFFTQLGEETMQEIDTLTWALEGSDRPGESYLEKVARLNTARFTAEGEVLREMVLIASPSQEDEGEDEGPLKSWQVLWAESQAASRRLRRQEQDEAEAETLPGYSEPE